MTRWLIPINIPRNYINKRILPICQLLCTKSIVSRVLHLRFLRNFSQAVYFILVSKTTLVKNYAWFEWGRNFLRFSGFLWKFWLIRWWVFSRFGIRMRIVLQGDWNLFGWGFWLLFHGLVYFIDSRANSYWNRSSTSIAFGSKFSSNGKLRQVGQLWMDLR